MLAETMPARVEQPERTEEAAPAILDLAHLRRYTLDDMSLQREVLGLFRDQVKLTVATLRRSCNDKAAWAMAAHTLKGTARAVGAFHLGQAAERAEGNCATAEDRAVSAERVAEAAKVTLGEIG